MRYFVTVAGRTVEVDLSGSRPKVDGRTVDAALERVGDGALRHLLVDGRSIPLSLRAGESRGEWEAHVHGRRLEVVVVDERTKSINEMTGGSGAARGLKPVRAPMPGLVVRIDVSEGDTVGAGQGIIIVEAMKMENELKADAGGIVSRIHVATGQTVEKGTVLVEFSEG